MQFAITQYIQVYKIVEILQPFIERIHIKETERYTKEQINNPEEKNLEPSGNKWKIAHTNYGKNLAVREKEKKRERNCLTRRTAALVVKYVSKCHSLRDTETLTGLHTHSLYTMHKIFR